MSPSGLAIATGSITAANELLFAPIVTGKNPLSSFNWRIVPATAIFALLLTGFSKISPELAEGIGITALVTVLLTRTGNAPAPLENVETILGYGPGGVKK